MGGNQDSNSQLISNLLLALIKHFCYQSFSDNDINDDEVEDCQSFRNDVFDFIPDFLHVLGKENVFQEVCIFLILFW